jgi:hypothetical protein
MQDVNGLICRFVLLDRVYLQPNFGEADIEGQIVIAPT